jgi:hypothetical protein
VPAKILFLLESMSLACRLASASVGNVSVCLALTLRRPSSFGVSTETNQQSVTVRLAIFGAPPRRGHLGAGFVFFWGSTYLFHILKAFEFCLPGVGTKVPDRPDWIHEIKYDGYRIRVERNGDRVRLVTRGGYDWTKRFPWIVESALKSRQKQFVIDGEAVILGIDGYSDFDALHSGRHNDEVPLCAFDVSALDGDDLRRLPHSMRKAGADAA